MPNNKTIEVESTIITLSSSSMSSVSEMLRDITQRRANEGWRLRATYGRRCERWEELFMVFEKEDKCAT